LTETVTNERRAALLWGAVAALWRSGHKLFVLHAYEGYPERIDSDLDAISEKPKRIPYTLVELGAASVVQVIEHNRNAFYYVLTEPRGDRFVFVPLDVWSDYRTDGRIFFTTDELLEKPWCRHEFFYGPPADLEFAYYLVRKVVKAQLNTAHAAQLSELYSKDREGCERLLHRFFPSAEVELIRKAAQSDNWEQVRNNIIGLRRAMLSKTGREHPLRTLRYRLGDLWRSVNRLLAPTGLAVAFLGADGSGKSTVIDEIERELAPMFWHTAQYRLQPRTRKRKEASVPVTDPHSQQPRGVASSLAKLAYWWADYTLGWMASIYPQLARSTFVLFDRYYHDVLVDPRRYRYGGPMWLVRLVRHFIIRPHLVILLDASPDVLRSRKQEVSLEETARHRKAYLDLLSDLPNGHLVDASRPRHEVVAEVGRIIIDHMTRRTARRLRLPGGRQ